MLLKYKLYLISIVLRFTKHIRTQIEENFLTNERLVGIQLN